MKHNQTRLLDRKKTELTPLQERFCQEWFVCKFSAKRAAIAAGISKRSATTYGHSLLQKPKIRRRIEEIDQERFKPKGLTAELFAEQLLYLCRRSVKNYHDEKGRLLKPHELSPEAAACVDGIKQKRIVLGKGKNKTIIYEYEYKFSKKQDALDLLARHKGLIASIKHEVEGKVNLIIDYDKLCRGPEETKQTIDLLEYEIMNPDAEIKAPVPNGESAHLYGMDEIIETDGEE